MHLLHESISALSLEGSLEVRLGQQLCNSGRLRRIAPEIKRLKNLLVKIGGALPVVILGLIGGLGQ